MPDDINWNVHGFSSGHPVEGTFNLNIKIQHGNLKQGQKQNMNFYEINLFEIHTYI